MNTQKKTARMVGALFITATVASILATFGFLEPILNAPNYLIRISANETQWITGVLIDAINSVAVIAIAVMLFPIFKKHNEALALGYVAARIIESVIFIVGHISLLLLLTLSQEFVKAGAPDASYFQTLGTLLLAAREWTGVVCSAIVFSLTALMLNYILYQSKLIPRWLSGWGLIGAILFPVAWLSLFGSTISGPFLLPIVVNEMVLAVWLIVKGFNSSAINSLSAKTDTN